MSENLHPILEIPYGRWVVISSQPASGALWRHFLTPDKMEFIENLHAAGACWVMQRKTIDPLNPSSKGYERVIWVKSVQETGRRR
jgi:hypothetical protein